MKELSLTTSDGVRLSGRLFEPKTPNGKILLINSATGVRQHLYFAFARELAEHGYTVITYDYRGIGESKPENMRCFRASMRLWGTHDFPALTEYIKDHYAGYAKFCLGHSVGALIVGMNPDANLFDSFIFIGTQDAYIGHLRPAVAVSALLGFGLAVPVTVGLLGYFPAHWFGLGETLLKGVALDWRTLILNPRSTNKLYEKIETNYAHSISQTVTVLYAEDDAWVTMKGMESLMNTVYPNLKKTYRELKVAESEKGEIGHINFFRSYNRCLWPVIFTQL